VVGSNGLGTGGPPLGTVAAGSTLIVNALSRCAKHRCTGIIQVEPRDCQDSNLKLSKAELADKKGSAREGQAIIKEG
jgi:hypothetical protein